MTKALRIMSTFIAVRVWKFTPQWCCARCGLPGQVRIAGQCIQSRRCLLSPPLLTSPPTGLTTPPTSQHPPARAPTWANVGAAALTLKDVLHPVSYTHLDVYKRQVVDRPAASDCRPQLHSFGAAANVESLERRQVHGEVSKCFIVEIKSETGDRRLVDTPEGDLSVGPDDRLDLRNGEDD